MATPLSPAEKERLSAAHRSWRVDGETASRTFTFADFPAAIGFVSRVALVAEKADHHPDIDIRWNRVTLVLSTHSLKRLSDQDRSLIEVIDAWETP
jgi:4a-hydroxytetrahydrobiopterin dehydratase